MDLSKLWVRRGLAALVMVPFLGAAARADFIAYDNSGSNNLQNFGSDLGLDFNVGANPITISQLGAFDNGVVANLDGSAGGGIDVGIFDRTTQMQVGSSVHFTSSTAATFVNDDAFLPVSFSLPAGFQGSVVAFNDPNYNSNGVANASSALDDGGGAISFVGLGRYYFVGGQKATSLAYPPTADMGPANRYDAGTFQFTTTPEPASLALIGLGGAGMLVRRRRA